MNLSYTTEYYPNLDELTQEQLDSARAFVIQKLREKFGDVDLSPGSVTGDLVIAPLSEFIAAADLAFSRFMSDLDLGNVADGVIYSCPFVEGFLGNFGVYDDSNLQSIGVVRLTFSQNTALSLARNVTFRFGSDDDFMIRFVSEHGEFFEILPSTEPATTADDTAVLVQTSETTWSVDIPVAGVMTTDINAGTAGMVNKVIPNLTGIIAVVEFIRGATPTSLPGLARMARRIYHSMSAASRYGLRATVYHHWPETVMVSPILPPDTEMLRGAAATALALPDSAVDVYYRSARDIYPMTQIVKLSFTSTATHNAVANKQRFRGKLPFLHSPSKIVSIKPVGMAAEDTIVTARVYSKPTSAEIPYGMHFGTRYEEFYVDIDPVLDVDLLTPVIPRGVEYTNDVISGYYAMFEVEYVADPLLKAVASHLESPDQTAAGVSTIVHGGPLVEVDTMTIYYHRRAGVKMLLNPAAEKIVAYAKTAGYPEVFTQAAIHDIMKTAGASIVSSIAITGSIKSTPVDYWWKYDAGFDPVVSLNADWYSLAYPTVTVPTSVKVPIDSIDEMSPSVVHTAVLSNHAGASPQSLVTAMTARTVKYRIEPTGINFVELA